jgi:hypothetical protein
MHQLKDKNFLISILKKIVFIVVSTTVIFKYITTKTAVLEGYVDGCDAYGYPFTYKTFCETGTTFSCLNLVVDIAFALLISIVLLVCLRYLFTLKNAIKNKIGIVMRLIALLYFLFFYLLSHINLYDTIRYYETIVLVFSLLVLAQFLKPIKTISNLLIIIGMIGYCVVIHLWAIDYDYKKNFDFKGESLSYNYSPFNNSFNAFFKKENTGKNYGSTNDIRRKHAIDFYLFLQCQFYEEEQNYSSRQKESIKNGSLQIIHSQEYSKGNLKEFIIECVKENKEYTNRYKNLTKQSSLQFENIVKYRYELFSIPRDE